MAGNFQLDVISNAKLTLVATLSVLSVILAGCGRSEYEYISLAEDMNIVQYGRAAGNFGNFGGLHGHSEMPVSYQVSREDYTLYADLDRWSIRPAVIFSIDSYRYPTARLVGTPIVCFASFRAPYPFEIARKGYPPGVAIFQWSPVGDVSSCSRVTMPDP